MSKLKKLLRKYEFTTEAKIMIAVAFALLFAVIIAFAVFMTRYFGVVHLTTSMEGTNVIDKRRDITYELAPMSFAVDIDKSEVYAEFKDTKFYRVLGIDPKIMIATEYEGFIDIYCSTEYELPSFKDYNASMALICSVEKISYAVGALSPEDARTAASLILEGQRVDYPDLVDNDSVLHVYFGSDDYKYLYYVVRYMEDSKGNRYLYDKENSVCVNIGDELKDVLGN